MTTGGLGSDLLRMLSRPFGGGGPRSVRLPVSIYGKLPIYKDFIRRGFADAGSQAFKLWLDQGFSRYWETEPACHERVIDPHLFVLRFAGTGRTILGYLWGSHDQGGLRRFPFAFFVSLPAGRGSPDLRGLLPALETLRSAAEGFRTQAAAMPGIDAFYQRFREIEVELPVADGPDPARWRELAKDLPDVAGWAASLWGERGGEEWPALLAYLERHLGDRGPGGGRGTNLALRAPRSPLVPPLLDVEILCEQLERARPRATSLVNLLLPLGPPADGVVLLARDLRPDDIRLLNPDRADSESIDDLRRAVPRGSAPATPLTASEGARPLLSLLPDPGGERS